MRFEITSDDVYAALIHMHHDHDNLDGYAEEIYANLTQQDRDRVAKAASKSNNVDKQFNLAVNELSEIITEKEFSTELEYDEEY